MKKKIIAATFALSLLGGASVFGYNQFFNEKDIDTVYIKGSAAADYTDKRNLIGAADYVFLGKVTSEKGQVNLHLPISQFNVEVLHQIKGKFTTNKIVLSQYGGYHEENGEKTLYLWEHDSLLEPDNSYLFAAMEQQDGTILIIPEAGNIKTKDATHISDLKKEFAQALKNQQVPESIQKAKKDKGQ